LKNGTTGAFSPPEHSDGALRVQSPEAEAEAIEDKLKLAGPENHKKVRQKRAFLCQRQLVMLSKSSF